MTLSKKYLSITILLALLSLISCTTLKEGNKWLQSKTGKSTININGFWYNPKHGFLKLNQRQNDLTGILDYWEVLGVINQDKVYLISYDGNNVYRSYELCLKNNELFGIWKSGINQKNKIENITFARIQKKDAINNIYKEGYNKFFYEPNIWLQINIGDPKVNLSGTWNEPEWGKGVIVQKDSLIYGKLESYELEGVIDGEMIYLVIKYSGSIRYYAILEAQGKDKLIGKYSKSLSYKNDLSDVNSWMMVFSKENEK